MFMVPKSSYPHSIILPYTYFTNNYMPSSDSLMKKFKKSQFPERGIDFEEIETSLKKCTEYQREYRGKAQKFDKINMSILICGLIGSVIGAMVLGVQSNWGFSVLLILCYIVFGWIVNRISKYFSNKYLKQGHFMLALICRCETNRVYMQNNIEMRPGFMGKWVEFVTHDPDLDLTDIIEIMFERQHKVKYSEFLEKEIRKGELAQRVRERVMNAGKRVAIGDIGHTSSDQLITAGKNEEEKHQILSDYQLAMML